MIDKVSFEIKNGFLEVEAESFHFKTDNGTKRDWLVRTKDVVDDKEVFEHVRAASMAGMGGKVSYKVKITTSRKFYVWARTYSSGNGDNGLHAGVDEKWSESGYGMQWCKGKHQRAWYSSQRLPDNHCGVIKPIFLNFESAREYIVSFLMKEDEFEMDKWILTMDNSANPE